MFSLISSGKLVAVAGTFAEAATRAKSESLVDGGWEKGGVKGRIVSVWSGPLDTTMQGTCKHASYACGTKF